MKNLLRPAVVSFVLLSAVTGLLYPMVVTGLSKALFPAQAQGSLIERDGNGRGFGPDRTELHFTRLFLGPPLGHRHDEQ